MSDSQHGVCGSTDHDDFVEDKLVFGEDGLVIEVVSLFEVPQELEEVVRDVDVNNDSLGLIAKAKDSSGQVGRPVTYSVFMHGASHLIRSYECSFCHRGFSNAQALGGHMNIHRRDRAKLKLHSSEEDAFDDRDDDDDDQDQLPVDDTTNKPSNDSTHSADHLYQHHYRSSNINAAARVVHEVDCNTTTDEEDKWLLIIKGASRWDRKYSDDRLHEVIGRQPQQLPSRPLDLPSSSELDDQMMMMNSSSSNLDQVVDLELRLGPDPCHYNQ
ncbi:hypothetical protein Sjap_001839 [Stephania japonica]|uniref:C2H2-type domain-containing protein n=1 Tax=Stephania japonica TaxID=461633 RepID=A0AAP0PTW7_9MAGN